MNDETKHPTKVRCNFNTYFVSGDTRERKLPLTPGRVYDVVPTIIIHPGHYLIRDDNDSEFYFPHHMFSVVETG